MPGYFRTPKASQSTAPKAQKAPSRSCPSFLPAGNSANDQDMLGGNNGRRLNKPAHRGLLLLFWSLLLVAASLSTAVEPLHATVAAPTACVPEGRKCTFNSDCCSKNCVNDPKLGKVCKPKGASWTCRPEGRKCTFNSDCCSKNCINDPKLGKVCKPKDASWTCKPAGRDCTFNSDCCSKNCVRHPKLGKICREKNSDPKKRHASNGPR
jgi:hypothetical protein